jgi:gamma-glutamylcyclotransferase (GGCT)/AIG2-like uncharacterized protein YtfP
MNTVKLIVYGTLMSGEHNHRFCRNAVNITHCTITGTLYDTGYGFPAFVPEGENTVAAELIEIPFEDWEAVDRLEGYPRLYDRLMFPAKLENGTKVSGWVYVMHNLPEMAQVIESGSWKEYRHG